jgi:endogenous inhibitor of DNA gyrase (YacG/DUF329 family)
MHPPPTLAPITEPSSAPSHFEVSLPDAFPCPHCGHYATMDHHPLCYQDAPEIWFHTDLLLCRCQTCAKDSVWKKQMDIARLVGIDHGDAVVNWYRILPLPKESAA